MSFKKLRGVALPEEKQGLIRYTCLTAAEQPRWVQEKIERLCTECGGADSAALHDVMCTGKSITSISMEHFISEAQLYKKRKRFYEAWYRSRK